MTNKIDWQRIGLVIEQTIKQPFNIIDLQPVSGGCINSAYILESKNNCFFIKLNQRELLPMFESEFIGLEEIAHTNTIKVPLPITCGTLAKNSFLILEKVSLISATPQTNSQLGHQLAALHKIRQSFFGWQRDNTIGSTEQINDSTDDWVKFWRKNRLSFQLSLAEKAGHSGKLIQSGEQLLDSLDLFFSDYSPQPSLLHGDLWSGNAAATVDGSPIIYDPACYYGDREADIAMTELFGGFGSNFYAAYNESFPLDSGYPTRKLLYNLYHVLNHLNLFGKSYQNQVQDLINSLLSEIY